MNIYESGEMYLETILTLSQKSEFVRSIDIAESMNFSKPSVSRAVKNLKQEGFIAIDSNGYISLTESGLSIANKIYERHTVLTEVLMSIGVDKEIAAQDACKIEHDISDTSFEAIKAVIKKTK
ncbi:MAG: metal-dependent transcriptional regulator [Clostridia bacterium]|nr:metal-dependent transcriptional regulator [Clostridia bacterium]